MPLYDEILDITSFAAKIMLESGGETYRVEQVVNYMSRSFGINNCESYATPTVIIVTLHDDTGKAHSTMRRIKSRSNNLAKVTAVNDLSYDIAASGTHTDIAVIKKRLLAIQEQPRYSHTVEIVASMFLAASFSGMMSASWQDFVSALLSGGIIRFMVVVLNKKSVNEFIINLLGGMCASFLGWLSIYIGFGQNWSTIAISSLMLLLPGLIMVNAMRDIVVGDLVSGISRGFEAVFIVAGIASGAAIVHVLLANWGVAVW